MVCFVFGFWFWFYKAGLYSPGCPGSLCSLRDQPASASQALGLKACATTVQLECEFSMLSGWPLGFFDSLSLCFQVTGCVVAQGHPTHWDSYGLGVGAEVARSLTSLTADKPLCSRSWLGALCLSDAKMPWEREKNTEGEGAPTLKLQTQSISPQHRRLNRAPQAQRATQIKCGFPGHRTPKGSLELFL